MAVAVWAGPELNPAFAIVGSIVMEKLKSALQ